MPKAQFRDGVADVARRFGVTVKTLRVYEEMALVVPLRNSNGWRTYGQVECERLHLVLLLRQLGLPLAQIAGLLRRREHNLASVLAVQERALIGQQRRTEEAMALVRAARARIAAGEELDLDTLADLVRRTREQEMRWTPALAELAQRLFSPEQKERLRRYRERPDTEGDDSEWTGIFRELARLAQAGDAGSEAALRLGRRAVTLIRKMTGNDRSSWAEMRSFWAQGVSNPALAANLPINKDQWVFFEGIIRAVLAQEDAT